MDSNNTIRMHGYHSMDVGVLKKQNRPGNKAVELTNLTYNCEGYFRIGEPLNSK